MQQEALEKQAAQEQEKLRQHIMDSLQIQPTDSTPLTKDQEKAIRKALKEYKKAQEEQRRQELRRAKEKPAAGETPNAGDTDDGNAGQEAPEPVALRPGEMKGGRA